jgi:hypothetical protein
MQDYSLLLIWIGSIVKTNTPDFQQAVFEPDIVIEFDAKVAPII